MSYLKNNPATKYVQESISEMKKVVWPTRKQITQHTIIVIVMSLILAAFLGGVDFILNKAVEWIISL